MLYLNQRDHRHIPYLHDTANGGAPEHRRNIATSGCGLCCLCMTVEHLTGEILELTECVRLSEESGANFCAGCSMRILGPVAAERYGLTYGRTGDAAEMLAHLRAGGEVIVNVRRKDDGTPGIFTARGHYMLLTGTDGKTVTVMDPNYVKNKYKAQEEAGLIRVEEPLLYCDLAMFIGEARAEEPYYLFKKAGR